VSTGLAGSVLEAKLDRQETPSWYCSRKHDWEVEWLSLKAASRPDCLMDELTVQYDPATRRSATVYNDPLKRATDNKHMSEQQCSFCNAAITIRKAYRYGLMILAA
jgi:hypothetical protein